MGISDWSSDVCSSDLVCAVAHWPRSSPGNEKGRNRPVVAAISVASCHRSRIPERRRGAQPSEVEAAEARGSRSARTSPSSSFGDAVYWGSPRRPAAAPHPKADDSKSEEHTSELQSLMRISYAVFCLKKKKKTHTYQ